VIAIIIVNVLRKSQVSISKVLNQASIEKWEKAYTKNAS
jgi:hypothetical protein